MIADISVNQNPLAAFYSTIMSAIDASDHYPVPYCLGGCRGVLPLLLEPGEDQEELLRYFFPGRGGARTRLTVCP